MVPQMHVEYDTRDIKKRPDPPKGGASKGSGVGANATVDDVKFEEKKQINEDAGKALLRIRTEKGISRKDMALQLAVAEQALAKWENGQQQIPGPMKQRLENFLKTKLQ